MKCIKAIVSGVVQGVNYRYFCYQNATEMNIKGYAKNLYNGDVEVIANGEDGLINDFIKFLKVGPRASKVSSVQVEELDTCEEYSDFSVS